VCRVVASYFTNIKDCDFGGHMAAILLFGASVGTPNSWIVSHQRRSTADSIPRSAPGLHLPMDELTRMQGLTRADNASWQAFIVDRGNVPHLPAALVGIKTIAAFPRRDIRSA
jgi:hypothetical protein